MIDFEWAIEGPFIVMQPTDANGETTLTYDVAYQSGDPTGKEVMFNIIAIFVNDPTFPAGVPRWDQNATSNYQLPVTKADKRNILGLVEP